MNDEGTNRRIICCVFQLLQDYNLFFKFVKEAQKKLEDDDLIKILRRKRPKNMYFLYQRLKNMYRNSQKKTELILQALRSYKIPKTKEEKEAAIRELRSFNREGRGCFRLNNVTRPLIAEALIMEGLDPEDNFSLDAMKDKVTVNTIIAYVWGNIAKGLFVELRSKVCGDVIRNMPYYKFMMLKKLGKVSSDNSSLSSTFNTSISDESTVLHDSSISSESSTSNEALNSVESSIPDKSSILSNTERSLSPEILLDLDTLNPTANDSSILSPQSAAAKHLSKLQLDTHDEELETTNQNEPLDCRKSKELSPCYVVLERLVNSSVVMQEPSFEAVPVPPPKKDSAPTIKKEPFLQDNLQHGKDKIVQKSSTRVKPKVHFASTSRCVELNMEQSTSPNLTQQQEVLHMNFHIASRYLNDSQWLAMYMRTFANTLQFFEPRREDETEGEFNARIANLRQRLATRTAALIDFQFDENKD